MRSLFLKLTLAFVAITFISVLSIVLIARLNTAREFKQYSKNSNESAIAAILEDYYAYYGSWDGIESLRYTGFDLIPQMPAPQERDPLTITDEKGFVVRAGTGFEIGQKLSSIELKQGIAIENTDKVVGYLVFNQGPFGENSAETNFLRNINNILIYGGFATLLVSILLGLILTRSLTKPIREMTDATQAIAKGDLGRKVPVRSRDELGRLATSFNQMSAELERSTRARRQMTADIAHELRTPVALILGHSEGVKDGVIRPNRETFNVIRDEAIRLERLVEDLRVITLADAGELKLEKSHVATKDLLSDIATSFAPMFRQKKIQFRKEFAPDLPDLVMDGGRIKQVLSNLLDNAMQHTPVKGSVTLGAAWEADLVRITVADTGTGVAEEELGRIFDRLYRADKSRQRGNGGSGLGLSIAKSIVELHGGKIWAEPGSGKGLKVVFTLPVIPDKA